MTRKTSKSTIRRAVTRKEANAVFQPVDYDKFKFDIEKRKRMQGLLQRKRMDTLK